GRAGSLRAEGLRLYSGAGVRSPAAGGPDSQSGIAWVGNGSPGSSRTFPLSSTSTPRRASQSRAVQSSSSVLRRLPCTPGAVEVHLVEVRQQRSEHRGLCLIHARIAASRDRHPIFFRPAVLMELAERFI